MTRKLARARDGVPCEERGLRFGKNLFLRVPIALILYLILPGQVTAQTFRTLYTFTGGNDGAIPESGLILSGNTLYGTAFSGGGSGYGTVFKLNIDGTDFTTLHGFAGNPSDGAGPLAGLILSSNGLYGTTSAGGITGNGIVFTLYTDGTGFSNLHSFSVNHNDGAAPEAGLVLLGSTLYGTALNGGDWGNGTVFAIRTDGTALTILHSFTQRSMDFGVPFGNYDGANPYAGLILSGNVLYGTASSGGNANAGAVFAVNTDTMDFTELYAFANPLLGDSDGVSPQAGLVSSGNALYGTAYSGGSSGQGAVFAINTNGTAFRLLHSFAATDTSTRTNRDGANPYAELILSGNTLYGTTQNGGSSGNGTLFKLTIDGTGFTTLYNFTGGSDGANPTGGLILSDNTLYGTASGGGSSFLGTVFSLSLKPISPPKLAIISAGTNVVLTWTNTVSAFTLESTTNLDSSAGWSAVPIAPVVISGLNTVTNPISGSQQFFRLSL